MGDLEWTNDLVIRLMQEYAKRPELWNPSHEMYRVQTLKYETWKELAHMFECDFADLRKKLNSLFASYRREKGKVRAGGTSTWFLYDHMSFFPTHVDTSSRTGKSHLSHTLVRKARPPVRAVDSPASYDYDHEQGDDDHDDPDYCRAEFLEEEEEGEELLTRQEVLIKEEPVKSVVVSPKMNYSNRLKRRERPPSKPRLPRPVRRRVIKQRAVSASSTLDGRLSEALQMLRRAECKDECDSFGEYIADSLRKHDDRTQAMIKQAINNILFEQEMKKYNTSQQFVVISGMEKNPLILTDETDK